MDTTGHLIKLQADVKDANAYIDAWNRMQNAVKQSGANISSSAKFMGAQVTQIHTATGASVKQLSETWIDGGRKMVVTSKGTAKGLEVVKSTMADGAIASGKAVGAMGDFERALRRVVIVVPLWWALRAAMNAVFTTLREGVTRTIDLEKAMARAQIMTSGVVDVTEHMGDVNVNTQKLMRETGRTAKDVAEVYTQFATAGIDGAKALQFQEPVLKTAIGLMGDETTTAKALAQVYNVLGDKVSGASTELDKMNIIAGSIAKAYVTNQVELDGLSAGLRKSAGTAAAAGLSFQELLAIIATLNTVGVKDAEAATVLNRILNNLVKKRSVVKDILGAGVDTSKLSTFELFSKVFSSLQKQLESGARGAALEKTLDLLGLRGVKAAPLETARGVELLAKSMNDLAGMNLEQSLKLQNDNFKLINDTLGEQLNIVKQVRAQLGETFVKAVFDIDKGKTAAQELTKALEDVKPAIEDLGNAINFFLVKPLQVAALTLDTLNTKAKAVSIGRVNDLVAPALSGEATNKEITKLIENLKLAKQGRLPGLVRDFEAANISIDRTIANLIQLRAKADGVELLPRDQLRELLNIQKEVPSLKIPVELVKKLSFEEALQIKKDFAEFEVPTEIVNKSSFDEYITLWENFSEQMQNIPIPIPSVEISAEDAAKKALEDLTKQLSDASAGKKIEIDTELFSKVGAKDLYRLGITFRDELVPYADKFKSALKLTNVEVSGVHEGLEASKKEIETLTKSGEKLVDAQLELLKIRGASSRQLADASVILEKQYFGVNKASTLLQRQLEIEKAITKEKMGQIELTDETVKLYEIAQKYGKDVANDISDIITGQKSLNSQFGFEGETSLNGQSLKAFEEFFGDRLKNFKIQEYFTKNFEGRQVRTPEMAIAQTLAQPQSLSRFAAPTAPIVQAPVNMPITVTISANDVATQTINKIISELKNNQSKISKAFSEKMLKE